MLERDTLGAVSGKGEWFFYGPGPDNLLGSWNYRHYLGEYHLFYKDDRGSVIGVKTTGGSTRGRTASHYLPFGGTPSGSPSAASENPGYNGQEATGGLVYMRNRWYDPNTGRFTQQDPIGFAGGINLYAYAGGDPITYSDPFGLCPYGEKRTEDVHDCPKDALGNAFRVLAKAGEQGRDVIKTVVERNINIRVVSPEAFAKDVKGRVVNGEIEVHTQRAAAGLALTIAHEVGHIQNPISPFAGFDKAVFTNAQLPSYLKSPHYSALAQMRADSPGAYANFVLRAEGVIP